MGSKKPIGRESGDGCYLRTLVLPNIVRPIGEALSSTEPEENSLCGCQPT